MSQRTTTSKARSVLSLDLVKITDFSSLTHENLHTLYQAACVVLEKTQRSNRTRATIRASARSQQGMILWTKPTDAIRNTYENRNEAVELGACAVAIVL